MSSKKWVISFLSLGLLVLVLIASMVILLDPYFHYHAPNPQFFYRLYNQRVQNNGIIRHFEYQGIIAGTSMTENFKASDAENLFGADFIKVPNAGGYFKEINDDTALAIRSQPRLRFVIRGLDQNFFNIPKDARRTDLGVYPDYLYDSNPFNDVHYLLNKNVVLEDCRTLIHGWLTHREGGFTDFDTYSNWMYKNFFGPQEVLKGQPAFSNPSDCLHLSDSEKDQIRENIQQNVLSLPQQHPDIQFYYFIPPYSAVYWGNQWSNGTLYKQLEIQAYAIHEILSLSGDNVKLFAFDDITEITGDLQLYTDSLHYSEDINTWMLCQMKADKHLLTMENYTSYLDAVSEYYRTFDFNSLFLQLDP